jgi:oligopeptide transport system substrate-binding protein
MPPGWRRDDVGFLAMWKFAATLGLIIALIIALIVAVIAIDRPPPRADLVVVNSGEVSTLDPAQMSWVQDFRAARLVYEGLTRSDVFSKDHQPIPAAASSWRVSEDGRTYEFRLRPEARWSNGDPVTSRDFRHAWFRMLLPDHGADYAKLLMLIDGAEEFWRRRLAALKAFGAGASGIDRAAEATASYEQARRDFLASVAIETPDDLTLRVRLVKPVPYFLSLTSFPPFFPVHAATVERFTTVDARTGQAGSSSDWCKPPAMVSNGPFRLVRWQFKREMRFERHAGYWNNADVTIDSVSMPTIEDGNTAVLAFRTGAVDWVSDVVPSYRAEMLAAKRAFLRECGVDGTSPPPLDPVARDRALPDDPRNRIHAFPAFGTYFYNFNCRPTLTDGRPNPFADARVRRAFTMAIDRRGLVDSIRRCGEPQATTLVPPGSIGGYRSPAGVTFDPAGARALLAEAGHPTGQSLGTVELVFNKEGGHDLIAQFIAKGWEEHLGVSVSLAQKEVKVFREQVKSGDFMISRGTWFGDYGDPTTFLDINRAGDGNNDRGYVSEEYESLMNAAAGETDAARRLELLARAEEIIVARDLPLAPIFHFVQVSLFDPKRLRGITPHPRQEQLLFLADRLDDEREPVTPRVMH